MTQAPDAGDLAVAGFVQKMSTADRWILRSWQDRGHDLMEALTRSRLLVDGRRHPDQHPDDPAETHLEHMREHPSARTDRQLAEHESAHCLVRVGIGHECVRRPNVR